MANEFGGFPLSIKAALGRRGAGKDEGGLATHRSQKRQKSKEAGVRTPDSGERQGRKRGGWQLKERQKSGEAEVVVGGEQDERYRRVREHDKV